MRLEPLCAMSMRYISASWHAPYGEDPGTAAEHMGFGVGDGEVTGDLDGTFAWTNYPRRREDGVWTPNVRGLVTTPTGDTVLVSMHGLSVREDAPGYRRALTVRIELASEVPAYRWLNTAFVVAEGEIDEDVEEVELHAYVCVNETAKGPPAVGSLPPERFGGQTGPA